jgi:hypothetical protein
MESPIGGNDKKDFNRRNKMLIRHRFTGKVLFNGTVNYLRGKDLRGAYLSGADLWGADLRCADLMDAVLRYANINGANLSGADLWGADLREAIGKVYQITGLCWQIIFTENQIQIGCEIHPVEEWRTFSNERIAKMDNYALTFWKKYKTYILDQYDFVENKVWE